MTQEEKQLLLMDLCARLPYGVKCGILTHPSYRLPNWKKENDLWYKGRPEWHKLDIKTLAINPIDCFYPYLRSLSNMTEEEREEERKLWDIVTTTRNDLHYLYTDFLLSHHLDFRGLIPMGLALEAPEDMYAV